MVQCTAFQAACRCIEFIATPKLTPTYVHGKGRKSLHRFGFVGQISGLADWIFTRFGRQPSYHLDFNQNPVRNTGTWNTKESIGESTCESICTTTSPTGGRLYSLFSVTIRCMYKLHQTSCSRQMVWDRQDRNASSRPSASYKWGCILTATNQLKL
jgi:hypothetical protein